MPPRKDAKTRAKESDLSCKTKRRIWRKLHIAINPDTHEILAVTLTASNIHDSIETGPLLDQIGTVATVTGDKAYDNRMRMIRLPLKVPRL